jgi:hypothetical protein
LDHLSARFRVKTAMLLCILVKPHCSACWSSHVALHAGQAALLCMLVKPHYSACWSSRITLHAGQAALLCMLVKRRCSASWSNWLEDFTHAQLRVRHGGCATAAPEIYLTKPKLYSSITRHGWCSWNLGIQSKPMLYFIVTRVLLEVKGLDTDTNNALACIYFVINIYQTNWHLQDDLEVISVISGQIVSLLMNSSLPLAAL